MKEALVLARKGEGRTHPNPPVGAILVKDNRKIGEGYHRKAGTDHAEIIALKKAGHSAKGATLYVTLEPCSTKGKTPPCTDAIIKAGVSKVVVSARDPNQRNSGHGARILRQAGISVKEGVCSEEGLELIAPFAKWVTEKRPFVTLKIAMTLDGRIADFNGKSRWITCPESRKLVQDLRNRADAVMVGGRTAILDNPSLLCPGRRDGSLLRIIVDSSGKLPYTAKVLNDKCSSSTIVATTGNCPKTRIRKYESKGARVISLPTTRGGVSLPRLMDKLAKMGIMHIVCEGGGDLAYSLIKAGLTDEYMFFIAAKLLGGRKSVPSIGGIGWAISSAPSLKFVEYRYVGEDILIRAVRKNKLEIRNRKL